MAKFPVILTDSFNPVSFLTPSVKVRTVELKDSDIASELESAGLPSNFHLAILKHGDYDDGHRVIDFVLKMVFKYGQNEYQDMPLRSVSVGDIIILHGYHDMWQHSVVFHYLVKSDSFELIHRLYV